MYENYYAVIMAGGSGTRLWPLSRRDRPKQMLALFGERTMFQLAVDRLEGLFPPERICVVTVAEQASQLQAQVPEIPAGNYFIEPLPRGTASVVGLAAAALRSRDRQAVMAILTADHFIGDVGRFRTLLRAAYQTAQTEALVTLGITPTYPATGYGYIQVGEAAGIYEGMEVNRAQRFKEKPDEAAARAMVADGKHAWNSGMFVWQVESVRREFERQMPDLHAAMNEIEDAWGKPEQAQVVEEIWLKLAPQTIDYGIMEGAENVIVIPAAGLDWNDVGSWESFFEVLPGDEHGNILRNAEHVGVETTGTLVYGDRDGRLIVTIGVEDLVVVDTGDVLMVCSKDQAQKVRQVVELLKKRGSGLV